MTASNLTFLSVTELATHIETGELSPVDIVETLLTRIERFNKTLGSYITVCAESALSKAREAEQEISTGSYKNPLHGIPISHKDISFTKGVRTTAHSPTLVNFVPEHDASHVRRLAECGMILLGKTNTTEFACGDMAIFGPSLNPWNLSYFSGASSGGSANAIATGLAVAATGTDTGGSIRVPASMCGIIGVKPTFGRVSRFGVVPLSWSMDSVGPMTRTVADAAHMLNAMAGFDSLDPTTSRRSVPDFTADLKRGIKGLRIGIPKQHFFDKLEPDVERAMNVALKDLEALGAELRPVNLPMAGELAAAANVLVMAEAYSQHAERLRKQASDYGPKARRRIATGAFYTAAEYQQAGQIRALWIQELRQVMQAVDALITPTLPFSACTLKAWEETPPDTSWATRHFNLSGQPALTLPCGFDGKGLPIGMQVVSKAFDEMMMFRIAHAYEQATPWHKQRPKLAGETDVA